MRAAFLALLCAACIERPFEEGQAAPRAQVDRSALREVMVPPPSDATPVAAVFGNAAELLAYKLEPPALVAGQRAKLPVIEGREPLAAGTWVRTGNSQHAHWKSHLLPIGEWYLVSGRW